MDDLVQDSRPSQRVQALLLALALVAAVLALYAPAFGYGFVEYDDREFLIRSPAIARGLDVAGLRWAMTASVAGNWHPVTLVSHMLDSSLYGDAYGGHHATNILLHVANVVLLFALIARLSGSLYGAALVAALFAVHPLNVEVVAWISQRKTLLATGFGWATLLAWQGYVTRPGPLRYAAALSLFALGLASKSMIVTLPAVMLLLDVWPFGRLAGGPTIWPRLIEKLPFVGLAVLSSASVLATQRASGALAPTGIDTLLSVTGPNALLGYAWYLEKLVWPVDLAVHYPHPYLSSAGGVAPAPLAIVAAAGVLLAISFACLGPASVRRLRWPAVGWLCFLGTLVPMIGLVQVGTQAVADRYAYLPAVGLFAVAVGVAAASCRRLGLPGRAQAALALAVVLGLAWQSSRQLDFWQSSHALYARAVEVSPRDAVMLFNLGNAIKQRGDSEAAIARYRAALAVDPRLTAAQLNLADLLTQRGDAAEAIPLFERVLEVRPRSRRALRGLRQAREGLAGPVR